MQRFYSLTVLDDPPTSPHHQACPCCVFRRRLEDACRSAYGMRAAGFSDRTIDQQLQHEGYGAYVLELAMEFVRDHLAAPVNVNVWCG